MVARMTIELPAKLLAMLLAVSALPGCGGAIATRGTGNNKLGATSSTGADALDGSPWTGIEVQRVPLYGLPEPLEDGQSGYASFTNYVVRLAKEAEHNPHVLSALVDPKSLTALPERLVCNGQPLAVIIDLDPGQRSLDLADPPYPMPGLAVQLDRVHKAGASVLWATELNSRDRSGVEARLAAVGLGLRGQDRVLMTTSDVSKADTERAASAEFCIVAIGGDQLGDFDESLVYLKSKSGVVGSVLLSNIGNGWFFTDLPTQ